MLPVNVIANYYQDARHGWIAVNLTTLRSLGLADKITQYSYEKGGTVYLEEDCDATLFKKTLEATGAKLVLFEVNHGDNSPIRNYGRYGVAK